MELLTKMLTDLWSQLPDSLIAMTVGGGLVVLVVAVGLLLIDMLYVLRHDRRH